jgi:hypothetical protein
LQDFLYNERRCLKARWKKGLLDKGKVNQMANFYKLKVVWQGDGHYNVGGNLYSTGDEFVLPAEQFNRLVKFDDIAKGYVEIIGESDAHDGDFSTIMLNYLQGKPGTAAKNYIPVADIGLVSTTTAGADFAGTQAADLSGARNIGRKVAVQQVDFRTPTAAAASSTYAPRVLVSAGNEEKVTPTKLLAYDYSAGTYTAATNGSIAAAAPITWAASDKLIIGYSEKFASVNVYCGTAATAGLITAVEYWDGSAWTDFTSFDDFTKDGYSVTNSFDRTDVNPRVVWYEKPSDWKPGGPSGAGVNSSTYVVALTVNGALTALASCAVYPMLDTPIASACLGRCDADLDAVVGSVGGVLTDYTDEASETTAGDVILDLNTTDYLFVGSVKPINGIYFDMDVANTHGTDTVSIAYWSGKAWSGEATVAADAWGGTVTDGTRSVTLFDQDGSITWTQIPGNWMADAAENVTGLSTSTPATVTTDALYWIRMKASAAVDATTAAGRMWANTPTRAWKTVVPPALTLVDADDRLHVQVIDEESTATVEAKMVVADV